MTLALEVARDADEAAQRVAALIAERAQTAIAERGAFTLALSKAPPAMLDALSAAGLAWPSIVVYQVDERVAPRGHPDRNFTALASALPADSLRPMPVEDADLDRGAERYADELPARLDVVHLGLGADGHTASLVPDDPVLDVTDLPVAVAREYEGRRRMTLTYAALDGAREAVWLVTGAVKREALQRLLARDPTIPAARVSSASQLVVADAQAAAFA